MHQFSLSECSLPMGARCFNDRVLEFEFVHFPQPTLSCIVTLQVRVELGMRIFAEATLERRAR